MIDGAWPNNDDDIDAEIAKIFQTKFECLK